MPLFYGSCSQALIACCFTARRWPRHSPDVSLRISLAGRSTWGYALVSPGNDTGSSEARTPPPPKDMISFYHGAILVTNCLPDHEPDGVQWCTSSRTRKQAHQHAEPGLNTVSGHSKICTYLHNISILCYVTQSRFCFVFSGKLKTKVVHPFFYKTHETVTCSLENMMQCSN